VTQSVNMRNDIIKFFNTSEYRTADGKFFFMSGGGDSAADNARPDALIFKIKLFLKKHPKLFLFLYYTLGAFVGTSAKKSIAHLGKDAVIISLGSGVHRVREDVVNVDVMPFEGVDIVADVHALPFRDNSIDAVIAEFLLEHLKNPRAAVQEMARVLKTGGVLYASTPFIIGYHSSPGDYYRWTTSGLRELFADFKEKDLGIAIGPTNALTYVLREWLAMLFSFNSRLLHQLLLLFFTVLFAPFNWLDLLLKRHKTASNIAHAFYYIGVKK